MVEDGTVLRGVLGAREHYIHLFSGVVLGLSLM